MVPQRMTSLTFQNADPITAGHCRILAEAGQCMEGSVERAVQMVHDAASVGAWGIKTQLLNPETIATASAAKYWDDDLDTTTQREAFTAAGLIDYDRWQPVRDAAKLRRIAFVATPFDLDAVNALEAINVDAYKIASGDLLYLPLLDAVCDTKRPIFLSTGAAWRDEIETVLEYLLARDPAIRYRLVLLGCSLVYPTPQRDANVGRVVALKELIAERGWSPMRVGYSDHTTSTWTARDAAAAGALIVEKHYTYKNAVGPVADHGMAVDPDDLQLVVNAARRGASSYGDASLVPTDAEERARQGARRGMWLARNVFAGDIVQLDDAVPLRPCPAGAMPPDVWFTSAGSAVWRESRNAGEVVGQSDLGFLVPRGDGLGGSFPRWA